MVYLHSIHTSVPPGVFSQKDFAAVQAALLSDPKMLRYAENIYSDSGIEQRHSAVVEHGPGVCSPFFGLDGPRTGPDVRNPGTRERNDVFAKIAPVLVREAVSGALEKAGIEAAQVTHLITVTCTGFFNPGPDIEVIRSLGIPPSVHRFQLGFMGCNAAFPALHMASQFCQADSAAVVLVVCYELCSLHLSMESTLDAVLGNSLFGDGAAAVVISAQTPRRMKPCLVKSFHSALLADGMRDMAWKVGDHGFDIVLSRYVPRLLGANTERLIGSILEDCGLEISDIGAWAVHPGGKSILDKVEVSLKTPPGRMQASRDVLKKFGNMSSATVLFVLKDIIESGVEDSSNEIFAMAFGPGLTVESALLEIQQ